jgi:hypothetical protein
MPEGLAGLRDLGESTGALETTKNTNNELPDYAGDEHLTQLAVGQCQGGALRKCA